MQKNTLLGIGILSMLGVLFAVFVLPGWTTGLATATPEIRIGVISPLTGSASTYGDPAAKGVILAAEEINQSGGILGKKVRLIVEDGACNAKTTASAANKLVFADGVKVILGGHCSTESLAIAPIANQNRVLQLATITSSDKYSEAGEYSFRNWPTSGYYVSRLGDIAFDQGARKIALLFEQKDFPVSAADAFKKRFLEKGGTIENEQAFLSSGKDLRTYLQKIKDSPRVDSIFFASQGDDLAIIYFKTLKELDMLGKYELFSNDSPISQKVHRETNGLNRNVFTTDVYVNPEQPKTRQMLEAYKARFGQYPQTNNFYVASSYDGLYLIKDAIEYCQKVDAACVRDYFYGLKNWEGSAGKVSFDSSGDAITSMGLHYFDENGNETWKELD